MKAKGRMFYYIFLLWLWPQETQHVRCTKHKRRETLHIKSVSERSKRTFHGATVKDH